MSTSFETAILLALQAEAHKLAEAEIAASTERLQAALRDFCRSASAASEKRRRVARKAA